MVSIKHYVDIQVKITRKSEWVCNVKEWIGYDNIDCSVGGRIYLAKQALL